MQPLPPEEARRDGAEDAQWSRPECQAWTGTLLLGTCLLYCARVSMPVCTVSMSQDFGWNKKEAGIVLSSFFWGYCLTQVVGGHLGDRIGGEKVIVLSASAWGFITAATPLLAHLSSAHLVFMTFSRILTGLLQGVYFPALTSLLSQKVRESERAFTYSAVGAGSQFGTLVTGAMGSLLLDWYGWPSVFYFSGGLTLLWVCYVYRYLLSEKGYRTIAVRKFMQVMGLGLSSVFALCLGHTSSFCKSVVFASASIGLQTFNHSGISVNIQDLAPSCAGFLFGVANTAGALADCPGALGPPAPSAAGVVGVCLGGYLIETTGSWTSMFNLVAAVSSLGLCTFLLFGEAQRVDLSPTHEDL
ncbi:solute carrier family 17 member 9 isoform X8 [Ursus americanus]|uniref:Solute carrier family 17 member 9 isoform X8 n=1 Tax=Ursus maritimus TaxID=29073 RepID=A0A8M1GHW6_URSMA|nr:solute carrier family 17 member 9 isoform X15 [Ursus arctos]XP_040494520.1 solute carrier family 17 member 9 isoform X8 [Ursus maritimus]XP_045650906.1 solute carrier family 17 member 9 isoform X8 [Ursus americanus]